MFFEDLPKGFTYETASQTVSEDDITGFARQWDPQYFHTDPEAATASQYGGVIASGFHTLLIAFTLDLASAVWKEASMGSPGMDELRWVRPVRPGDTLRVQVEVTSSTPSQTRDDRGRTGFLYTTLNQRNEIVMVHRCVVILAKRGHGPAQPSD